MTSVARAQTMPWEHGSSTVWKQDYAHNMMFSSVFKQLMLKKNAINML